MSAPAPRPARARARAGWTAALTAVAAATVVAVVMVAVPLLRGDGDADPASPPIAAASGSDQQSQAAAPARGRTAGLLDWPARGRLAGNDAVLPAAVAAWQRAAAAGEAPTDTATLLYAGPVDGRQVVLVQALDQSGRPRVAQLVGATATALRLVGSQDFRPDTAVLSIVPPQGPSGPVRVLVAPQAATAGGLLASDVSSVPLKPAPVGEDGVSGHLPAPPGSPTCSRVVVLGPADGQGRTVLQSGIVRADLLTAMTGDVEVGAPTLVRIPQTAPETRWFADGAALARKLGKGPVVVAALGPAQSASAPGAGRVSSQLYELRRGSQRWLGSVVSAGRKTICAGTVPVRSAGVSGELTALVQRCPMPGRMMPGLVHVVGGPGVRSVQFELAATPEPAGQRAFTGTAQRPGGAPSEDGFTALVVVPEAFPCGPGRMTVIGENLTLGGAVPVYTP